MDKKKFEEILDYNMVCPMDARYTGVHCRKPREQCSDCGQEVVGRRIHYIKKISTVEDYWSKRCETCKTTLTKTYQLNRDFLGLDTDRDK